MVQNNLVINENYDSIINLLYILCMPNQIYNSCVGIYRGVPINFFFERY